MSARTPITVSTEVVELVPPGAWPSVSLFTAGTDIFFCFGSGTDLTDSNGIPLVEDVVHTFQEGPAAFNPASRGVYAVATATGGEVRVEY